MDVLALLIPEMKAIPGAGHRVLGDGSRRVEFSLEILAPPDEGQTAGDPVEGEDAELFEAKPDLGGEGIDLPEVKPAHGAEAIDVPPMPEGAERVEETPGPEAESPWRDNPVRPKRAAFMVANPRPVAKVDWGGDVSQVAEPEQVFPMVAAGQLPEKQIVRQLNAPNPPDAARTMVGVSEAAIDLRQSEPNVAPRLEAGGPIHSVALTQIRGVEAPGLPEGFRAVSAQVVEAVRPLPKGEIELVLQPEDLGAVKLKVTPTEQGMVVHLAAERTETLDLMRRNLETLLQDFRSLGLGTLTFSFGSERKTPEFLRPFGPKAGGRQIDETAENPVEPVPVRRLDGRLDMKV